MGEGIGGAGQNLARVSPMRSHNDEVSPMGSNDDEGNRTHRNEVIQSTTKHCEGGHHYESWENVANTVGGERRRALRSCVENVSEICHVRYIEAEVDRKGDTSYGVANDRLLTLRMASRLNDLKKKQ